MQPTKTNQQLAEIFRKRKRREFSSSFYRQYRKRVFARNCYERGASSLCFSLRYLAFLRSDSFDFRRRRQNADDAGFPSRDVPSQKPRRRGGRKNASDLSLRWTLIDDEMSNLGTIAAGTRANDA